MSARAMVKASPPRTSVFEVPVTLQLVLPGADIRLFGKPESFERRRMGVALASARDVDSARQRAKEAAGKVKPVPGRE
jgi:phosphoribosylglycinamide formyltransferase 2